jgi:hypothetical protein
MQTECIFFACIRRSSLAHQHLLVVGPERLAVDKLHAKEILVPDVKAAEDLNLRPLVTASATPKPHTLLHAPHQPPNLTFEELIVPAVGYRQPEPIKPVCTAKVVQKVGQFGLKVLENRMFHNVGCVFNCRIRGPNGFAQGCEAIGIAMIISTMQRMSHPVRCLSPPPDIALKFISQTTFGLPASRPVEAPGSNQH